MKATRLVILLLVTSILVPLHAALHDSGPMGDSPEGVATPDAAALSRMQLLDQNTPMAATQTASVLIPVTPVRQARFHPLWLQIRALSKGISEAAKSGKLTPDEAANATKELGAIEDRYHLSKEEDGQRLTASTRRRLKLELDTLNAKVAAEMAK